MRRETRDRKLKKSKNSNTSIFVTGGVLVLSIGIFIVSFIIYSNKLDSELYTFDSEYLAQYTNTDENNFEIEYTNESEEETEIASSSIGKNVEESEKNIEKETATKQNNKKTEATQVSTNTTKPQASNVKEKDPTFVKPIEGEILKEYAKDSLVYSETLKEWTTHLGIDIKAERATVVKAAADGTVKYIKNDPRYGLTIIIEHSNGFETRYANLLTTEFVSEGEEVKSGQTIGTVGDSAIYEIVDESHLHFELLKNSESMNPAKYINF